MASAGADPFLGTVGERLVLPDRHFVLEIVDQLPAGLEGLSPVRAGNGDHDGEIPDPETPDPMHGGKGPHRILGDDLFGAPPHLGLGTGVTRIPELVDVGSPVVIPYGPDEQGGPPGGVVPDGPEDLVEG